MQQPPIRKAIDALLCGADLPLLCQDLFAQHGAAALPLAELARRVATTPETAQAALLITGAARGAEQSLRDAGHAAAYAAAALGALQALRMRLPHKTLDLAKTVEAEKARVDVAIRLAALPHDLPLPAAMAACAWLDAGHALLDAASDGGQAGGIDAPGPAAAAVLEEETARHGADHTLAGKWLAEHWRVAPAISEAIWLHHHSIATIELAAELPQLCYFVMLADALADARRTGAPAALTAWTEQLCKRLGLRPKEVLGALRASERGAARHAEPERALSAPVQSTEARYRALCAMHGRLHAAATPGAVLLALAHALRDAFGCPRGACQAQAVSASWDGAEPALGQVDNGLAGDAPATRNMIALPITHDGRDLGQVWMALPAHAEDTAALLGEITAAIAATGAVLDRAESITHAQAQSEALAGALHRAEAARQREAREARLDGLSRFAAGAAHEINNPLAVISGRAQLLLSQHPGAEHARALDVIVQQSRRISRIVSDLMQFARPPAPKWTLAAVPDLLRNIAAAVRERLQQKHILLVEQCAEHLPQVEIDRMLIEQAIMNGLLNAEQALEKRGGAITLSARAAANGKSIEISIRDNGEGIGAEHLEHVFDPFYTTKQFVEGSTGLGLTVCRSIVAAHHGQVTFSSRPGEGAVLTITLPAAAAREREPEAPRRPRGAEAAAKLETVYAPVAAPPIVEPRPVAASAEATGAPAPTLSARDAELGIPAMPPADTAPAETTTPARQPGAFSIQRKAAPTAPAAAQRSAPHAPAAVVPAQGRILIIEENEDLREVLRAGLVSRGYETDAAPDGLEGLASALAHPPALVICSTRLSGVDALTLMRQVRQRYATLPVIVLAGPGPDDTAAEVLRAGARALLHKPFDFERLLGEVTQYLAARNVA